MVTFRSRKQVDHGTGSVSYNNSGDAGSYTETYTTRSAQCDDAVGNFHGANGLFISKTVREGCLLNASKRLDIFADLYLHSDYNGSPGQIDANFDYTDPPTAPNDLTLARILAQSGPLTPKVNLPLFVYELKDIPKMLKHAGDLLHKIRSPSGLKPIQEAAAATLAYQFGWAPLVEDIGKLLGFAEAVAKRQRILDGANNKPHGQRTKIGLGDGSESKTKDGHPAYTYDGFVAGVTATRTTTWKRWGVVRWKLKSGQGFGKPPGFTSATRSLLGLHSGMIPVTVWKAIPWTWMIDWFADISNVLQANANMAQYDPDNVCSCMTHEVKYTSGGFTWNNPPFRVGSLSPGTLTITTKVRTAWPVDGPLLPTLKLPFMDNFKLSILGSLTILKIAGRP